MSVYKNGVLVPVAPATHEGTHVSGGSDDIDSALDIAAMANLATGKMWQGNANRPVEVDPPAVPSGLIAMWHGLIANIPAGWLICDGNNSTPNLLAKFIEGVATAATNPGTTGGATAKTTAGHVHSGPSHVHSGPSHTHAVDIYMSDKSGSFLDGTASHRWIRDAAGDQEMADHDVDPTNIPFIGKRETSAAGGTGNTGAGGTGNTGSKTDSISDIRPLFYDIAFLMKT